MEYIEKIIKLAEFSRGDFVLDAGIGTGLVTDEISPLVWMVVGVDTSPDMLGQCQRNGNILLMEEDMRKMSFLDESFDKVVARNVFHHILENPQQAMNECYRVLKDGGRIIVGERTPPSDETKEEYAEIFKIKDERNIFLEEDLILMMKKSGFKSFYRSCHRMMDFSVRGWLESSGISKEKKEAIFNLHINGSDDLKKAYNMRENGDDCLIDIRNVIVVGEK